MRYLLDSHVWIWAQLDHPRLSRQAKKICAESRETGPLGLAAISLQEVAWLLACGRAEPPRGSRSWSQWLREAALAPGVEILPITVEIAIDSQGFPPSFSRDPADRLIAATARTHDLTVITADREFHELSTIRALW